MTAIYYDTEFHERGYNHPIELISIGLVAANGDTYYAISNEFDVGLAANNPWLWENVMKFLPMESANKWRPRLNLDHPEVKSRLQIREELKGFVLSFPEPELWADYCSYDHVVLCQLFGRMIDLPEGFPMRTNDVRQEWNRLGKPKLPRQDPNGEHHALCDAHYDKIIHGFLIDYEQKRG